MSDRGSGSSASGASLGSTAYFAVMHPGFTLEWPSGLVRRTVVDESGTTFDEGWTARKRWEPSTFFIGPQFGDFTDDGVPYAEVDPLKAERIREMLGVWPRGGPFRPAGQAWLAAHPDDPAAKYLGVAAPSSTPRGVP
jgi:hypothetical protein